MRKWRALLVVGLVVAAVHGRAAAAQGSGEAPGGAGVDVGAVFEELVGVIEREHAYARLRGLDLEAEAAREAERLGERAGRAECVLAAQRLVAQLGDGHASVDGWLDAAPEGCLPFLLAEAAGGVVAFKGDRSGFVDEAHPFIESMDGRPIEEWIDAASVYVPAGSPQLVRRRSIELLRYVGLVRGELGLPARPAVEVGLRSADGSARAQLSVRVRDRRELYGAWPRRASGVLESGVGYLRIESMSVEDGGAGGGSVAAQLEAVIGAPGLIIDVRGNGGGGREVIPLVMSRLLDEGEARVVSVAVKRLPRDGEQPDGVLRDRGMYPAAWDGWGAAARAAIERVADGWQPEWSPPEGWEGFSGWHYYVVSGSGERYAGPVVVLMDDGCFSATDILLGGLKGMEGVTLVGTASSGGSANVQEFRLETLGVGVRLGTMASFTAEGRLYDGRGIEPDVVVERRATDLIGRADAQLEAAEMMVMGAIGGS